MNITLYLSRSVLLPDGGGYVLVPDCLLPSTECERLHGPLFAVGQMAIAEDHVDGRWQSVLADIDRDDLALIELDKAEQVFGVRIMRSRAAALGTDSTERPTRTPERSQAAGSYLDQVPVQSFERRAG